MDIAVVVAIVVFALIGAPLFAVYGAAAVLLFARLPDTPLSGAAHDVFSEKFADSPILVTIPLFTLSGVVLAESGASRRLVAVSRALFGFMPGGLAIVCIMASAVFTTLTGGSGITIIAIGGLLFPILLEERYPERFSLGLVTTGGSLGMLFPPSLPVIIYGVVASADIQSLYVAALVPGLITTAVLITYAGAIGLSSKLKRSPFEPRAAATALWTAKWEALLPVALLAGLALGVLRIHEAAAFTALYVLIVEIFVYRDIALSDLPRIIGKCVTLVGAILIILATAVGFTAYLIQANVPQAILEGMQRFISTKWTFLLALNLFVLVVGTLMEVFSAIVVVVPLVVPIANYFGVNPYHLGAVFLLNLEIGYLAPPVGLNLFLSSLRFERPMAEVYRAVLSFTLLLFACLLLVTYVPALSIWSPHLAEPLTLGATRSDRHARSERPSRASIAPPLEGNSESGEAPANRGETLDDLLDNDGEGESPKPRD